MIVFDSKFEILAQKGADKIKPIETREGKFYLNEGCYNENKELIDSLSVVLKKRKLLVSEIKEVLDI